MEADPRGSSQSAIGVAARGQRITNKVAGTNDIVEMAVYIGRDSFGAANRFLDATDETFAALTRQSFLGAVYPTKNPRLHDIRAVRVKNFPNHLAFYFARPDGIEVVRVLHGAQDLDAALDE